MTSQKYPPPLDRDYPDREVDAPQDTLYTAARRCLLNSAILLRLGALTDAELRRVPGRVVVWLNLGRIAADIITADGVQLVGPDAPAGACTALENAGFVPMLLLPELAALEEHVHYLRNRLGIALPRASLVTLTRGELLAVLATYLQVEDPVSLADDAWADIVQRQLAVTRQRAKGLH